MSSEESPGNDWWQYDQLPSRDTSDWSPAHRGDSPFDAIDFHLDIGCGTVPKARLGIDRFWAPGVDLLIDLEKGLWPTQEPKTEEEKEAFHRTWSMFARFSWDDDEVAPIPGLPFPDDSIKSIITHHCLEHIRDGFIPLMDEMHRVLEPGGFLRIITPLFPSYSAVADPDHKRYFMEGVWETFCGTPEGEHWMESFSVPYTKCRFEMVKEDRSAPTPPDKLWTPEDAREMRVTLRKWKV